MKKRILFLLCLALAVLTLGACTVGRHKTVTFVYNNGTPDVTVVVDGEVHEPDAPIREGYAFVGWTAGTSAQSPLYDFAEPPAEDHTTLTAVWREMPNPIKLTVHPENGEATAEISYRYSAIPKAPDAPKWGEYAFMGWYANPECTVLFDFSAPLTEHADIYAGWRMDPIALGNMVAESILPTTVKIHTTRSSGALLSVSLGSGVIYAERGGYYYVLTNRHVVEPQAGYGVVTYKIFDAYGNEYTAYNQGISATTDLAVLRFAAGKNELPTASFADSDPEVGALLISVGNPGSLTNCVTYGHLTRYDGVSIPGINVTHEVAFHNAPIDNGSSGGAVFDTNGRIVGINFAAATDADGNFVIGAFIQRSVVGEFLTSHNLVP